MDVSRAIENRFNRIDVAWEHGLLEYTCTGSRGVMGRSTPIAILGKCVYPFLTMMRRIALPDERLGVGRRELTASGNKSAIMRQSTRSGCLSTNKPCKRGGDDD